MNIKSSIAILEKIYQIMMSGMRSNKSPHPQQWLRAKKLSSPKTYAAFNSGQLHHSKPKEFIDELASVGFLEKSGVTGKDRKTCYTCFGNFSIIFPLRNEDNHIVNFYEMGIKKERSSYLNEQGIYPSYPHPFTQKLIITDTILDAATILEAEVLNSKEAVMALHEGKIKPQHQQAIGQLKELSEVIYIELKKNPAAAQ
jgi:hypothetical protein